MLNTLFESNQKVQISNGCLTIQLPNIIKTTYVNVFNYLL